MARRPTALAVAGLAVVALAVTAVLAFGGGGSGSGPGGYLATNDQGVTFIQWTDSGGRLVGSMSIVSSVDSTSLNAQTVPINGVRQGSQVSLTASGFLGASTTLNGELHGSTLVLQVPQSDGSIQTLELKRASVSDYNSAAAAFRATVSSAADAAARAQAAQQDQAQQNKAVDDANVASVAALDQLATDVQTLTKGIDFSRDYGDYQTNIAYEQGAFQREQNDAASGAACYTVASDDASVASQQAAVQGIADAGFHNDSGSLSSSIKQVQSDIANVQQSRDSLRQAQAQNPRGVPLGRLTDDASFDRAVASANTQLDAANGALSAAQSKAKGYDDQASAIRQSADQLAARHAC